MKILLVSWISPLPTNVGSSQRTNLLHRALSEIGDVDLALLRDPSDLSENVLNELKTRFGLQICTPIPRTGNLPPWKFLPLPLKWRSKIGHNIEGGRRQTSEFRKLSERVRAQIDFDRYDLIVGRYLRSVAVLGLYKNRKAPMVIDVDDWEPDRYKTRIHASQNPIERLILRRHLRSLNARLPMIARGANSLWIADPANKGIDALRDAIYLPNIPFDPPALSAPTRQPPNGTDSLMTIGSYIYPPNVAAVHWFLNEVWPRVLAQRSSAKFFIYGSHLGDSTREAWSRHRNVEVIGYIDRVEDAYRNATVAICAVRSGAGTNIKVLEAMCHRKPCISTLTGARGFSGLVENGAILASDDPQSIADSAVRLLADPADAQKRGDAGAHYIGEHLSWKVFKKAVHDGARRALANSR